MLKRLLPFWSSKNSTSYRSGGKEYSNSMQHLHHNSNSASASAGKPENYRFAPPAQAIYVQDEFSFSSTPEGHDKIGTRYPIPPV